MGKNKQSTHEVIGDPNNDIFLPVCWYNAQYQKDSVYILFQNSIPEDARVWVFIHSLGIYSYWKIPI
jgi:hypothetical protein